MRIFPDREQYRQLIVRQKNPNCFWRLSFFSDKRRIEGNIGSLSRTDVFCACRKTGRFWVYYYLTHIVNFWPRHCPAHSRHSYTPGRSRRVLTQARGMSVSRLHCTLGFDDPALHLLVGSQTFQFFAAQQHP